MAMPRNGRGGRRVGTEGTAYSNRKDLNQGPRQPRADLSAAAAEATSRVVQQQVATPAAAPPASGMPNLLGPTAYPDRPVTHGLPSGPGAGPEALGPGLAALHGVGPDPDLVAVAQFLPALEIMASQPGASVGGRNLVRRLRGAVGQLQGFGGAQLPPPPVAPPMVEPVAPPVVDGGAPA